LRERRITITTARDVASIAADLAKPGLRARELERIQAEQREAVARDEIDRAMADAAAALTGVRPVADPRTSDKLRPVLAWLTATTGVVVASVADVRALLLLAITELGAAVVPLAMALATSVTDRAARRPVSAPTPGPARQGSGSSGGASGAGMRGELADVLTWLTYRTVAADGGMTTAAALYADYEQWMAGRGRTAVSKQKFGGMLSEECAIPKRKAGAAWTVNYLGLELRPVSGAGSRLGRTLRVISGSRAA
jgi:hypothetical protein